ncbi:MAG: aspartyl/glutamyl-tRNA amidotransferase subunit C [Treponema sp.]|jgi:aspartyl-tRNA(Asn)/glutamyl-tRNA(Gln) amidotransferase subunit C|nr:aspartyl/glutamyl-tRNA amidotransferase subunit C [Treponema sp.]
MKIEDLKETADLAHLNLSDEELAAAFPAFEQMLGYFAAMQAADQDESLFAQAGGSRETPVPAGQNAGARIVDSLFFRPDAPAAANREALTSDLLNNAGGRDGRFLVIPNVL